MLNADLLGFYLMMNFSATGDATLESLSKVQFSAGGDFALKFNVQMLNVQML